jgi:hypothetical protein
MSRSSDRHGERPPAAGASRAGGRHGSGRRAPSAATTDARGQFEAVAALVAVAAVCTGLTLYTGALSGAVSQADRDLAEPTLREVADRVRQGGVVRPAQLEESELPAPDGYRVNVTVSATGVDRRWNAGPAPPADLGPGARGVDVATGRTSVRVAPARVRSGRLRVVVWR